MNAPLLTSRLAPALAVALAMFSLIGLSGCGAPRVNSTSAAKPSIETGDESESRLRVGDLLQIRVETSVMTAAQLLEVAVEDNGNITLPLIGSLRAQGLSTSELADQIQKAYVPKYYVRCTTTVLAPVRFFYVGGEVRAPSRYPWAKDLTLSRAINAAGGFTDFANRSRVEIARGKTKLVFDCEAIRRQPDKDVAIQPGDSIYVPRSIF